MKKYLWFYKKDLYGVVKFLPMKEHFVEPMFEVLRVMKHDSGYSKGEQEEIIQQDEFRPITRVIKIFYGV